MTSGQDIGETRAARAFAALLDHHQLALLAFLRGLDAAPVATTGDGAAHA